MSQALNVRHTAVDSTARTNAQSSAQVKRYWPGRAPDWVDKDKPEDADSDEEEEEADVKEEDDGGEDPAVTAIAAPVVLKKVADPRLARLSVKEEDTGVARPKVISRRQARGDSDEGSDESASESEEESEEEDEAVTARRAAVRERLKRRQVDQEEELLGAPGSEGEEEESESEYETDSEEEEFGRRMLKPVFVTKKERETIAEREALEREEEEAMKKEKARLKERAKQTKEMVIEQLQAEEAAAQAAREGPKEQGDIDTDDEQYAEQEYVQWKNREYARIRREREEREAQAEAEAEKERIRNMTPSERAAWERDNPRVLHQAPKKSWKFMQKYWHKGAFFQEVSDNPHAAGSQPDDIYVRDYSAPTGEDKLNKEMLPKVMQVKNFGRRGQTKYTHLVDQDTTVRDDYYNQDTKPKKGRRQAGTDQVFEKPKKFLT